jgi:hypothetical protein
MDELVAQGAARPSAGEKRLVAVEPLLANLAVSGFNPQHHRFPTPAGFSDTHAAEYSEGARREARGVEVMNLANTARSQPTSLV